MKTMLKPKYIAPLVLLVAVASMLAAAPFMVVASARSARSSLVPTVAFAVAFSVGVAPALRAPADGTPLFELHPTVTGFAVRWEPRGV